MQLKKGIKYPKGGLTREVNYHSRFKLVERICGVDFLTRQGWCGELLQSLGLCVEDYSLTSPSP